MNTSKAIAIYANNQTITEVISKGVKEAVKKASRTLGGLSIGGVIGALIDGPRGALIGGGICGLLGFIADVAQEKSNKSQQYFG